MSLLSISQAADQLGVPPRVISDLFWQRLLDRDRFPLVGTRRAIPVGELDNIRDMLIARGKLPQTEAVAS
jgi:hypothetical protein